MAAFSAILHRRDQPALCLKTTPNSIVEISTTRTRVVFLGWIAGAILLCSGCALVASHSPSALDSKNVATDSVRVERKDFLHTVRLHGIVEAVQSYSVIAPRLAGQTAMTMVMTKLVKNGTQVHEGDILVEFDRQNQMKNVQDRQAEYDDLLQQIKRRQADQAVARASDDTDLKSAEVDVQAALVDMRKNDVIPATEAEINKQNLAEAEARLKLLKDTQPLKRTAEAADLRILEIQRDRTKMALEYAQANIERMSIKSPLNGLVVLTPIYRSSRYIDPQEGDEVRPGYAILKVVDPSAMQVRVRINQVDLLSLQPGQVTEVRLDAYPDMILPAVFDRTGGVGIASSSSRQIRYFTGFVAIKGTNPKLLPDLTAAADVRLQKLSKVLVLPREAIVSQNGETAVMVMRNGDMEKRAIKIGTMNEYEAVIESGVEEGTVVARNPQAKNLGSQQLPEKKER
jgi:multidrug resistance efflux pump